MRIGILGTGTLAGHLGEAWAAAGHELVVGGRVPHKARVLAERLGQRARAATMLAAAEETDVVLLAVSWSGVGDTVRAAGGADGVLAGKPLMDPTNAVEHGIGELLMAPGTSCAEQIADQATGAHVVKAFHMFPADTWSRPAPVVDVPTVPLCGDDAGALEIVAGLVADAHGHPVVLGGLRRARQLEEAAGFIIGLAFSGANPAAAVPTVEVGQAV